MGTVLKTAVLAGSSCVSCSLCCSYPDSQKLATDFTRSDGSQAGAVHQASTPAVDYYLGERCWAGTCIPHLLSVSRLEDMVCLQGREGRVRQQD